MCGIAGFVGGDGWNGAGHKATLAAMASCIRHRGPDHSAVWSDPGAQVGLAHNRLAILDLSPAGNQPMHSESGRFVIVYNGEIYNHEEIRAELAEAGPSPQWRGHSDTETLLAAIERWGIRGALERSVGMFAFALWDRSERTLILARDRLGEKPLYYGRQRPGGPFLFASELSAMAAHPAFRPEVDRDSLTLLLRYNNIPAPFSIYRGIFKLPPGSILLLPSAGADPIVETYWSGSAIAEAGVANPLEMDDDEAVNQLETLLERSVKQQMLSDVPLGAFLSGGVDSSTIVALMQKLSARPVKTFTIGFDEQGYNEAEHAKAVAGHLGTDHTELYVTGDEARGVVPKLSYIYDEPFADASQIPTHLVSALARQQVTVALSGDAGDELFGGYNRHLLSAQFWRRISAVPKPIRAGMARAMTAVPAGAWNSIGRAAGTVFPKIAQLERLGEKIHKGAPLLGSESMTELYGGLRSLWRDPASVVIGGSEPPSQATAGHSELSRLAPIERMMTLDMVGYLPDDILVKVDRAAMAVSLETRVPFLDHRVVEFAWRVPLEQKIRNGTSKWILRQVLDRYVPKPLIERPKMGFGVPIDAWLRGPLRDWAEDLLDERRLREEGYFRPEPIRDLWRMHLRGSNRQYQLWTVLMFQSWLRRSERQIGQADETPVSIAFG